MLKFQRDRFRHTLPRGVVVANLKPRKMRGLESQGMICAASLEDNSGPKPALAAFLEDVEIGLG